MKIEDKYKGRATEVGMRSGVRWLLNEEGHRWIKSGEVHGFIEFPDGSIEHREIGENLVVDSAGLLVAEHMKGTADAPSSMSCLPGVSYLAIGQGGASWNPLAPPAPQPEATILAGEYARVAIASTQYVNEDGQPVLFRTNIVDFIANFRRGEATGAMVEAGLFGGVDAENTDGGTMVTYRTFPVWNLDDMVALTLVWRLVF